MSLVKLFDNLVYTEPNQIKLTVTSDLSFLSKAERAEVEALYLHSNSVVRICASLINAAYTQRKVTFLFSKKVCNELLKGDPRQKRKSVNSDTYKKLKHFLLKNNLLSEIKASSDFGSKERQASLMEFIAPEIVEKVVKLVGQEYLIQQKAKSIEFYDSFLKGKERNPRKGPREESPDSGIDNDIVNVSVHATEKDVKAKFSNVEGTETSFSLQTTQTIPDSSGPNESTDKFPSVSTERKINYCLGSKEFTKERYRRIFIDYRSLVDRGVELSQKQLGFINDSYAKVLTAEKKDKLESWYDYADYCSVGSELNMTEFVKIYDEMVPYYKGHFDTKESEQAFKDQMVQKVKAIGEAADCEPNSFWNFIVMLSRFFNGKDPYQEQETAAE